MNKEYKDFIEGMNLIASSLQEMSKNEDNRPIKFLIAELVGKMNLASEEVASDYGTIKWAVENDDATLEKLTAKIG